MDNTNQIINSQSKAGSMQVGSNDQTVTTMVKVSIEKCFHAAGFNVIEGVVNIIHEAVRENIPEVTVDEFSAKLKELRTYNKERISVPLILDLFKPWETITRY